ncbi:hypothetical protein [Niveibacterium microcysteis]|uniref:Cobalt-zinc-cadmium resistance protein n=1 Tax=Niveibacterium microcysteis TaxID=2811415 RepID=A0ABX7M8X3_9RHOO|nr:hypothetical protein [Niveibacterium microcysteis]QSI78186.1 hypothetical protein JY500_05990 [Niveibacterium microcysteis]
MRRLVFVLLLVFLPLQSVWGAAASYCRHETGSAAKHFGHHEHQHQQGQADRSADAKSGVKLSGSGDFDCATCHLTTPTLTADLVVGVVPTDAPPQFIYHRSDLSHIPAGPERPDRALA